MRDGCIRGAPCLALVILAIACLAHGALIAQTIKGAVIARRANLARARNPGFPSLVVGPLAGAVIAAATVAERAADASNALLAHNIKVS